MVVLLDGLDSRKQLASIFSDQGLGVGRHGNLTGGFEFDDRRTVMSERSFHPLFDLGGPLRRWFREPHGIADLAMAMWFAGKSSIRLQAVEEFRDLLLKILGKLAEIMQARRQNKATSRLVDRQAARGCICNEPSWAQCQQSFHRRSHIKTVIGHRILVLAATFDRSCFAPELGDVVRNVSCSRAYGRRQ